MYPVPQQIAGPGVPQKSFGHLARERYLRGFSVTSKLKLMTPLRSCRSTIKDRAAGTSLGF